VPAYDIFLRGGNQPFDLALAQAGATKTWTLFGRLAEWTLFARPCTWTLPAREAGNNMSDRQFQEQSLPQGADERVAYDVDLLPWGGYTSGAVVVLKDNAGVDVSATNLEGPASVAGTILTTPIVKLLAAASGPYRLEVRWVYLGNTFEAFGFLEAET